MNWSKDFIPAIRSPGTFPSTFTVLTILTNDLKQCCEKPHSIKVRVFRRFTLAKIPLLETLFALKLLFKKKTYTVHLLKS